MPSRIVHPESRISSALRLREKSGFLDNPAVSSKSKKGRPFKGRPVTEN